MRASDGRLPRGIVPWPVAALVIVVCGLGSNMPTALYDVLRVDLGFSAATQTAIFGAYMVGVLPGLLVLGRMVDRFGRRNVLLVAVLLTLVASVGFLFAGSVPVLLGSRLLQGVSVGAATAAGVASFFETLPAHRLAIASLLAAATTVLGAALGPPVGGWVAELFGRSVIAPYVLELALVTVTGVLLFTARARPTPRPAVPDPTVANTVTADRRDSSSTARTVVPGLFMTCVLAALSWMLVGLFQAVGPTLLSRSLGTGHLGVLGTAVALVMAASAITATLARRWPVPRLRGIGLVVLTIGCAGAAATLLTEVAAVAVAAAVVIGIGHGLVFLAATRDLGVVTASRDGGQTVVVTGIFYAAAYLSTAVSTFAVGVLAGVVGLTRAALALVVLVAGVSALLALGDGWRRWVRRAERGLRDRSTRDGVTVTARLSCGDVGGR